MFDAAQDQGSERGCYEICVHGHLGETLLAAFPDLRAQTRGADTVLIGVLPDQAALYGVLARLEALGLELLEVRCPRPRAGSSESPGSCDGSSPRSG